MKAELMLVHVLAPEA